MQDSNIKKIVEKGLDRDVSRIDSDWCGSILIAGLLRSENPPSERTKRHALDWLEYHIHNREDRKKLVGRVYDEYTFRLGTYVGGCGPSFAAKEIFDCTGDPRARQLCLDIGDLILHRCGRNSLGLVLHDDGDGANTFTIPDVAYFVIPTLLIAASFESEQAASFRRQAMLQLEGFINLFLDREKGIVKTVCRNNVLGDTYWVRANSWLMWTIIDSIPHLDKGSDCYAHALQALNTLAEGLAAHQDASGAFHVLLDEADLPLETSGTSILGYGLHKAVRLGLIDPKYLDNANRAWDYVLSQVDENGNVHGVYCEWALPAEDRTVLEVNRMDSGHGLVDVCCEWVQPPQGSATKEQNVRPGNYDFIPGMILTAYQEFRKEIGGGEA